jgi:hypothetical protein
MGFRQEIRAATISLLEGYRADSGSKLQIYPGRPKSIYPPTAFPESINEASILYTAGPRNRNPSVDIIWIQAEFDSEEAVTLQDAAVDDFIDWVTANSGAAGPSTLVTLSAVVDLPNYQPDWIANAPFYFASRLTLDGLKSEGGLI